MKINNRCIGSKYPPYVIAEMSANHNGKIDNAFRIIDEAKKAGADAVKMQSYTPDTITLDCDSEDFLIQGGLWGGQTLYELYKWAHTPWDWHAPLFEYARKLEITIFSSPFDETAIDMLEDLGAPAYKIASFEIVDLPLIKYAASTGKPMIISTGMAGMEEIREAVEVAVDGGCGELALLLCVSGYPAPASDYNLRTLSDMVQRFGVVTGISDHTLSNATSIAAVALGASIVEKHFTLDRSGGGPDDSFSLEPDQLAMLCQDVSTAWEAIGDVNYEDKLSERDNIKFRRSLYFAENIRAGDVVVDDMVRSVRPGGGMLPKYKEEVVGKRVKCDINKCTPVSKDLLCDDGDN